MPDKELIQINVELLRSIRESKRRLTDIYKEIEDKATAKSVQAVFDQNDIA